MFFLRMFEKFDPSIMIRIREKDEVSNMFLQMIKYKLRTTEYYWKIRKKFQASKDFPFRTVYLNLVNNHENTRRFPKRIKENSFTRVCNFKGFRRFYFVHFSLENSTKRFFQNT